MSNIVNSQYASQMASLEVSKVNKDKNTMGKDDFLKLLVTQLRYQDPMKPMEDKEFIAQMAQFSSLEQMQNMADGFMELKEAQMKMLHENYVAQAVSFIGKEVDAVTFQRDAYGETIYDNSGMALTEFVQGEVRGVKFDKGQPILQVQINNGDQTYMRSVRLEEISQVIAKQETVALIPQTEAKEDGEEEVKDNE
ncbi:flagellar hook capping FlgD N-terminal domain-containing protein [Heliorestis acidaminivorans]|nr:flagellar hook capping FlgD N-terminal domain-containing protein [Heliorestis acidaminivorans]